MGSDLVHLVVLRAEFGTPPGRTIYEPGVQFGLENELSNVRMVQEQDRYIESLKDRWVSSDINDMRRRLLAIARLRYITR